MIKELKKQIDEEILKIKLEVFKYAKEVIKKSLKDEIEALKCVE